ncbi:hypothetical protein LOK49_LG07G03019 [Camellia lanceoleosa]|uniref:Uncharacterized protein n=1 Tax=Camellia lanceoleosa TaxID=1840588 RepID=A0ACC0H9P7_9ERIC|nr:hypothetical protein LOK49_LG07G03019 [Camellia lanceoleosa]
MEACQRLASHRLFDVHVKAIGDIHIDDHHSNEDVALAIGTDHKLKNDSQRFDKDNNNDEARSQTGRHGSFCLLAQPPFQLSNPLTQSYKWLSFLTTAKRFSLLMKLLLRRRRRR